MEIAKRFDLRERIGGGAAADVHHAFDRELDREVVVRLLRDELAVDGEYVERFQREAEAAADIRHANVVEVLDHGVVDGRPFLVRELVEGSTLEELLDRRGALPEEEARALGAQIARGLEAAHARGILHRDLNAKNVFVTPEGTAKVVDFGKPAAPRYPAPEQAAGEQIDERADVYGLGVVLYQMLTAQTPGERPVSPRRLARRVSKRIETVAMRALEHDPARRYATAAAMADALDALAAGPVRAVSPLAVLPAAGYPEAAPPEARLPGTVSPEAVLPEVLPPAALDRDPEPATPVESPVTPLPFVRPTVVPPAPPIEIARPITRIGPAAAVAPARGGRVSAWTLLLIGLPLLLALVIGAVVLPRPTPMDTALFSTAAPLATTASPVSPTPTTLPTAEITPEPTPVPEPTSAPSPAPAVLPPTTQSPVVAVVRSFYALIEQKRFDEAAGLWSPRMQANYPPSTNIYGRFDRTRQIVIRDIAPVAQSAGAATVAIDILEVLDSGVTRHWVGQWHLVSDGSRWLMDAPSLRQA